MYPRRSFHAPIAAAALLLAVACGRGNGATPPARPAPLVRVTRVEVKDLPVTLRAPVDLRPLVVADVGSKTLGYLDAVLVDRGDVVRRGQVLALVRPSDLPDQLAAARGTLAQTQAAAELARTNLDRAKVLAPSAVVSQQELQQAQAALATSQANEAAARAQIAALGVRLGETRIISPLDGVVATRRLDPGALVSPSAGAILTVVRTNVLRVFVAVTEKAAAGVAVGKGAYVEVDAVPGRRFAGTVVRMSPAFDPATRTLEAEVQLPNDQGELKPGMYGRATIVLDTHKGARVLPASAVIVTDSGAFAYVHEGGVVKRRVVKLGFDAEEELEVVDGLSAGEEVVVAGLTLIADGMKVRVARGGSTTDASRPPTTGALTPRLDSPARTP